MDKPPCQEGTVRAAFLELVLCQAWRQGAKSPTVDKTHKLRQVDVSWHLNHCSQGKATLPGLCTEGLGVAPEVTGSPLRKQTACHGLQRDYK